MLQLTLGEKQSGPGSAGFTRNQLIRFHTVFKWYSWKSKCYILLLVKNSLDPDWLASSEISLSDIILFSNDTLKKVNVISYYWWKNSLDPDQLASPEISLSGFILFPNDALEIDGTFIRSIFDSWWKTAWTQISWPHQKSAYLTSYCFQMILLKK